MLNWKNVILSGAIASILAGCGGDDGLPVRMDLTSASNEPVWVVNTEW